jgi:CheY-like chemotaxis protein
MAMTGERICLRILVIDDYPSTAESLAKLLTRWGHKVEWAMTASEGLRIAENFRPDIIFLDIAMPGLSGYEVARRIKEQGLTPRPFLVALSGFARKEDREQSLAIGFDAHLLKPASRDQITEILNTYTATRLSARNQK